MKGNIFYAQSGGVTPVINATASGLIEHFFKNKKYFGRFYAGKNGILGALNEELIDITSENKMELKFFHISILLRVQSLCVYIVCM